MGAGPPLVDDGDEKAERKDEGVPLGLKDHPCERLRRRRRDGLSERHTPGPNRRSSELAGDGAPCTTRLLLDRPRRPPVPPAALVPPPAPDRVDTMATCTNPASVWSCGARLARHRCPVSPAVMDSDSARSCPRPLVQLLGPCDTENRATVHRLRPKTRLCPTATIVYSHRAGACTSRQELMDYPIGTHVSSPASRCTHHRPHRECKHGALSVGTGSPVGVGEPKRGNGEKRGAERSKERWRWRWGRAGREGWVEQGGGRGGGGGEGRRGKGGRSSTGEGKERCLATTGRVWQMLASS